MTYDSYNQRLRSPVKALRPHTLSNLTKRILRCNSSKIEKREWRGSGRENERRRRLLLLIKYTLNTKVFRAFFVCVSLSVIYLFGSRFFTCHCALCVCSSPFPLVPAVYRLNSPSISTVSLVINNVPTNVSLCMFRIIGKTKRNEMKANVSCNALSHL